MIEEQKLKPIMKNKTLKEIVDYAVEKLKESYGYCGLAGSESMAFINSDDGSGGEIKITIKIEKE